jgi:hypothetical protein
MRTFNDGNKFVFEKKQKAEPKFVCTYCHIKYTTNSDLKRHVGQQHPVNKLTGRVQFNHVNFGVFEDLVDTAADEEDVDTPDPTNKSCDDDCNSEDEKDCVEDVSDVMIEKELKKALLKIAEKQSIAEHILDVIFNKAVDKASKEKPEFKCQVCEKVFKHKHHLKWHYSVHTKESNSKGKQRGPYKSKDEYSRMQLYRIQKQMVDALKLAANTKGLKMRIAEKVFAKFEAELIKKSKMNDTCKLDEDDLISMIQTVSLSTHQTIKNLKIIREKFPHHALISPNIHKLLIKRNLIFKKYFTTKQVAFEDKDKKEIITPVTYCNDLTGFIQETSQLEAYDYRSKQNVLGADVGKGAMVVSLTQPGKNPSEDIQGREKNLVKQTKVLAYARNIPETYRNMDTLFSLLQLKSIVAKYSLDNKLINMILGMQSHSAKFPCAFGECFKGPDGQYVLGIRRTVQNCKENAEEYEKMDVQQGDKRKKLKLFKNNEFLPLLEPLDLENGEETPVWAVIPFPPLHTVLLGQ